MRIRFTANTDLSRMKGLMFQEALSEDECALFEFPRCGKHGFWNNNVDFPISLIFCDEDKKVVAVKGLDAQQKSVVYPDSYNIKYVVEAHVDAPQKLTIQNGSIMNDDGKEVMFK